MAKYDIKQLTLDFHASRKELKAAVDKFGKTASAIIKATSDNPEAGPEVSDEMKALRKQINRLIGILAEQSGLSFHAAWVLAYHEHHERTGFHAVAASGGKGTHLDQIAKEGHLPELQKTVVGMLTNDAYKPGVTKR